ncbi:YbjN domain-containing protein [Parvularcula lutaonensis]|uniref:YbjN domain-containing protein n=1 Tax=Parvularcula lutaonensis TaxID=491923 RepID=A0ABV7M9S3_9PROT|nr:YbjN domain-containing protein [Parvularcula lutaonensis]GGY43247.1 hypothetical protein GCM10007148_09950 [Parvularcula lutaonensis]
MFRILAILAAFAASVASAQIPAKLARTLLPDVSAETIRPVLRQQGLTPETQTISGRDVLVLRSDRHAIILQPRVCNPKCTGLLMITLMEGSAPSHLVNDFNQETPPTMAYTQNGATVLSRYLIADHGITAGTLLVNIGVFDETVRKWLSNQRASSLSVSLAEQGPAPEIDTETRELLSEIRRRPELISGRIQSAY